MYWIIPANTKYYNHKIAFDELITLDWRRHNSFKINDTVLIYSTKPDQYVTTICKVIMEDSPIDNLINDKKYYKETMKIHTQYVRLTKIKNVDNNFLHYKDMNKFGIKGRIQSARIINNKELISKIEKELSTLDEIDDNIINDSFIEGEQYSISTTRYERDIKARNKALDIHGYNCDICGINLKEFYNLEIEEYIQIHHKKPLFTINDNENYIVNPKKDLIPLCPNCHNMVHLKLFEKQNYETIKYTLKKGMKSKK